MLLIGVDPHKSTHTATAIDPASNQLIATIRIESTLANYRRLLTWARTWPEHTWAVEGASGLGRHLTQWLLARGEHTRRYAAQLAGHTRASSTRLCNAFG